ncbi:MAG TPA: glycosyltransferase [Terriglobales bacterium]|nr:glycosyltransferase [Terriglobales bacterium]
MSGVLNFFNESFFVYYLTSNLIYLGLLITALVATVKHQFRLAEMRIDPLYDSPFTPPITILCPARNEEKSIVESVRALLDLKYPELEIIVINDGSSDRTLDRLIEEFSLVPVEMLYIQQIRSAALKHLYTSATETGLLVIDKISGGSKADAINAGINAATSPYICIIDADSILEGDALFRIMSRVFTDSTNVVAIGGIVRVLNGSTVERGRVTEIRLPKRPIEILQVIEYLRAFLIGREGWASFGMLPIISGAFGVFRTDVVRRVGGYRADSVGEDLDLVVRMQRDLLERGVEHRVVFVPDPTCWTEVPSDLRTLSRQRSRWQKGLIDVLCVNSDMLFRRRYGLMGCLMLPYLWAFELLEPAIELLGYASMIIAACLGVLGADFFFKFLLFGYAFATMISVGSVLLEELTYRRYTDWSEVAKLLVYCTLEHFPYRQLHMIWRLQGIWQYLRGDLHWREMRRVGFQPTSETGEHV